MNLYKIRSSVNPKPYKIIYIFNFFGRLKYIFLMVTNRHRIDIRKIEHRGWLFLLVSFVYIFIALFHLV